MSLSFTYGKLIYWYPFVRFDLAVLIYRDVYVSVNESQNVINLTAFYIREIIIIILLYSTY